MHFSGASVNITRINVKCLDEGDGVKEQRLVQINMYRPSDLI